MKYLFVRRLLPAALSLLLLLAVPPHVPTVSFVAGDDTKIGPGPG